MTSSSKVRKRYYEKCKKDGICPACTKKSRKGKVYCGYCARKRKAWQKKYIKKKIKWQIKN